MTSKISEIKERFNAATSDSNKVYKNKDDVEWLIKEVERLSKLEEEMTKYWTTFDLVTDKE